MFKRCTKCEVKNVCEEYGLLEHDTKMYKKSCYIEEIMQKMNLSAEKFFKKLLALALISGIDMPSYVQVLGNDWKTYGTNHKRYVAENFLRYWIDRNKNHKEYIMPEDKDIKKSAKFLAEVLDVILDADRNAEIVPCIGCGKMMQNSKQRNRLYCDKCKREKRRQQGRELTCTECGETFNVWSKNNRQYRCDWCQMIADKESARERAKRYRDRKKQNAEKEGETVTVTDVKVDAKNQP